ncbi:nucleoporin Nup188 [Toxorhynchites rutilus septentrionalis]|uniref:nucleoporin Nup188 n=1 Tax=Toxorhynchites rutilus septentrionalis TaxID=329112 RepID=UPI00247B1459|nr:nucleoporin Nup188 [Toxorhynchites rutilus septentrionalis]
MEDLNGNVIQWKKLWQLISGIHYETPNSVVRDKLNDVSKELSEGLLLYKKAGKDKNSEAKLQKTMKERNQQKLLQFAMKLYQYLDIDALQAWNILCFYLVNEYRGPANALMDFISTESSMLTLLNDIWSYYSLERMAMLKVMKNLLEFYSSGGHPYSKEYKAIIDKIGFTNLRKSCINQLEGLINDSMPGRQIPGDIFNSYAKMVSSSERKLREINEVLHIILLIIHHDGISVEEFTQLFKLFKSHSFGRQQQYLDNNNENHNDMVKRITYSELSIIYRVLDPSDRVDDVKWIEGVIKALENDFVALHQFPEHGPLLLVWMLFNFRIQNRLEDDELSCRYRQFGSKAVQLGVFEYLLVLVSHPTFKDYSIVCRVSRKAIFNHLGFLCQLFDSDGSVANHAKIIDLFSELLHSPSIASELCKNEDSPIRSLFNTTLENFPIDFSSLAMIAHALASAGVSQNKYVLDLLENLPVYSEIYNPDRYELRPSATNEDEFILSHDYVPFRLIGYKIPRGTSAVVIDKRTHTIVHFRTKFNFFDALHHEINELLSDALAYTQLNEERIHRITTGIRYLAVAVKRVQQPTEISSEMVHPNEMVFDILLKFKVIQNPPIELLAECLNVCASLVPLFEPEIYARMINLNILPMMNNANLDFKDYAAGTSFESSLIGYYLVNFEKNAGKYRILLSYLNFLKTYSRLGKNNIFGVELPGLIFLLREVFPHVHSWRFEQESERQKIYVSILQYLFEILQLSPETLKTDYARTVMRNVCVYSLLDMDNGMTLLKFVGVGNGYLQSVMENETSWMMAPEQSMNQLVQLSMTILMQILRLKHAVIEDEKMLSPLESAIYTQPKQRDTLRIIPVVTGYMSNIFNRRLPILSCRLLRRFSIEFKMSLLACLDMEPDQIRSIFLLRLRDDLESDNLKIAVLEFVEACIHRQPGLTEAFFKVNYEKNENRLFLGVKPTKKKNISDGVPTYMEEYLETISNDPKKLASPLLSRFMSLFHALWKNNIQVLCKDLLGKTTFWSSLCNPLFSNISDNIKAYSQLFNILGIELFGIEGAKNVNENLKKVYDKFLEFEVFSRWVRVVFELPRTSGHIEDDCSTVSSITCDETPEWLSRLQSFKDLMVLLIRKRDSGICLPDRSKRFLADHCLEVLLDRAEYAEDLRPFVVLAELYLIILSDYEHKYTDNTEQDEAILQKIQQLLNALSINYKELHVRAKESILGIAIKTIELQADQLIRSTSLTSSITRSTVDIVCQEIFNLETLVKFHTNPPKSTPGKSRDEVPLLLAINLLKKLVLVFEENESPVSRWQCWFIRNKVFQRLLSVTNLMLQLVTKRKITVEVLELLVVLAKSRCSEELLHCDIGDYLWLKLLPPNDLLQRPYGVTHEAALKWKPQDWWLIYTKGIELVRVLLAKHKHRFFKEAIFFAGIHEEYLIDSLLLAKQSMEASAIALIKGTLELLCELVNYEKEWRLEHSQSLINSMRGVQILMDHAVSLLYRPKILKRLSEGPSADLCQEHDDPNAVDTSDELIAAMNNLIEIVTLCTNCLLKFSPNLINLLCDVNFSPTQWYPLIEIQFGVPKMNVEHLSQLSFGTVLRAVCIFTKVLNVQHYTFQEIPLNELPTMELSESDDIDATASNPSLTRLNKSALASVNDSSRQSSTRVPFSKSLSMTSVSSFTSTNAIALSNELLTHLDSKLCINALELVLTLLASQSLLALKDTNLSQREKQLIKRELSTELLIFHDFVKKRILKDSKEIFVRKKYGAVPIYNTNEDDEDYENESSIAKSSHPVKMISVPPKKPDRSQSMRVNVVRKQHLQHAASSTPLSPITHSRIDSLANKALSSTPAPRGILKPPNTASIKRVMFEEGLEGKQKMFVHECPEDEPIYFEPEENKYTGLSYVRIVEEDYLHCLSNVFLIISQSDG